MPLRERTGIDKLSSDQEIKRFLPLWKAKDLFQSGELYLRQVAALRSEDPRESRLPDVLLDTIARGPFSKEVNDFVVGLLRICESQADIVFASSWFLPGSTEQEARMWKKYGGGSEGGIVIESSLERLISVVPDDIMLSFGIGLIRYIPAEMSYVDAVNLNEYRSVPFLLKVSDHEDDREVRLFQRYAGPRLEPQGLRLPIDWLQLVRSIRLSPLCPAETRKAIYAEFVTKGVPRSLFEYDGA
jgi:hypothetical protein